MIKWLKIIRNITQSYIKGSNTNPTVLMSKAGTGSIILNLEKLSFSLMPSLKGSTVMKKKGFTIMKTEGLSAMKTDWQQQDLKTYFFYKAQLERLTRLNRTGINSNK